MRLVAMSCTAVGPLARSSGDEVAKRGAPLARRVCAALGTVALALASASHATGLFLPVGPAGATAGVAPTAKAAPARRSAAGVPAWGRRVRIARHELAAARADVEAAGAGRLLLNVRDGVRLDVDVERTVPTRWGYSLSGRVVGGSGGFATLVVHDEVVAGSIWTPDSAYELAYLGGGVHALRDVTNAQPVECAGALSSELSAADGAAAGGADDGSVVDVLVVWTPAAEEAAGGEAQVLSWIDLSIAYTNDAFERSGAFVQLNLVGAEWVDYLEVTADHHMTNLNRLRDPDDGHLDGIHDRRNALGADLVYLLTAGQAGGRAEGGGSFAVGLGMRTFAHEVGHNFGIAHERNQGVYSYHHGFTTGARDCYRTIMSYGTECPNFAKNLPLYASPWRYSPSGRALGVARFSKERSARGPADAVLTLNGNRHSVANFRPSRQGE